MARRRMCQLLVLATLLSVGWSQGPEDCIENVTSHSSMNLAVRYIPLGVVCFQCDFGSGVAMDSTFKLDGYLVDSSDGVISMGVLVIFNTTNVFSALLKVLTCASGENTITSYLVLTSFNPPLIVGNATVMEGDTLFLDCDPNNSLPPPTLVWISPQRITLSHSRHLEINYISRTQNGTYTCVVTAADGSTMNTTITVAVIVNTAGPQDCIETVTLSNDQHLQTQYALPGIVCFQCGSGVSTDSTFMIDLKPVDRIVGNTIQGVLVIFESDEVLGNTNHIFTCSADGVTVSSTILLKVFQPPLIVGNATVMEGDTLSLDCDPSNSQPLPIVSWISPQGITLSNSRDLEISDMSRTQAGAYTCVATDFDQQTVSSVASVIVQYAPVVSTASTGTHYFPLGMTLQLSCHYSGIPPPHLVTWRHNGGTLMESNSDITVVSSDVTTNLTRTNLPAYGGGSYECSATNVAGSDSASFNVTVQLPPGPPTNLTVTASTSDSLSLSWFNPSFDGFSPISSFRIAYTNLRTMATQSRSLSGGLATVSHMLADLSPFTNYSVAVHVRNAVELEGEAANINGQTRSLRPRAVTGLTLQPLSSTQILVQWEAPAVNSTTTSPITSYTITYQEEGGGGGGGESGDMIQVLPPSTSVVLGADGRPLLMKGTEYNVIVVVSNQEGPGLGTSSSVETHVDPPTFPLNFAVTVVDPFTLQLTWLEPSDTGGRPIATYSIAHRVANTTAFSDTEVAGGSRSYQIRNLMQDTDYEVVITAINLGGLESPNVTAEGRTAEVGPPQVPAAPVMSSVTNQSALASWTDPGGYPFEYLFQFKRLDAEWSNVTATYMYTLNSTTTSYQLTILQPVTAYSVRVASSNINGLSNYSPEATIGTYGDVDISAPTNSEESPLPRGQDILLTCSLSLSQYSPTNITYTWSRVNGVLPENSVVDAMSGTLIMQSPSAEDSGTYKCTSSGVSAFTSIFVASDNSTDSLSMWIIIGAVVATVLIVIAMSVFFVLCFCCWRKYYKIHPNRKQDIITTLSLKPRHKGQQ